MSVHLFQEESVPKYMYITCIVYTVNVISLTSPKEENVK